MNSSFLKDSSLQLQNQALKRKLETFETGEAYVKIRRQYESMLTQEERKNKILKKELAQARAQAVTMRNHWFEVFEDIQKEAGSNDRKKDTQIKKLKKRIWELEKKLEETSAILREKYEDELKERDAVIKELANKLAHAEALLGHDGTNTGIPTAQTPIDKKKVIPNSRRSTGKKKGGQPGHERHVLIPPAGDEIDVIIAHEVGAEDCCPRCGGQDFVFTGRCEVKYEIDIKIETIKKRHEYYVYECLNCGERFRMKIAPHLRSECQYGPMVQATALSLMNTVNSPINKVRMFLSGLTCGQVEPCEGYIAKLQWRASSALKDFMDDLRRLLITRVLVYWDDTVIMVNKARGCLRFYGDEMIALYTAHLHKDMDSLDDDNVLSLLTAETTVMHDHNKVNYNEKYSFQNIECNQHLQRDLQKSADDTGHTELLELKELISKTIKERKDQIAAGADAFDADYIKDFETSVDDILDRAQEKNTKDHNPYFGSFEETLINRIREYRANYFAWVRDFSLPTTDNLSERALRCVKSHMKMSGQFESEKTAGYFARIKSYVETCRRNGINEIHALSRLCKGDPYTVKEIFATSSP